MERTTLRWWLWTCLTFVILGVSGLFGFFGSLLAHDFTYIGFGVIALYVVSTLVMWYKVRTGDTNYDFLYYVATSMEKLGLLGTVIGLIIGFSGVFDGIDLNNAAQMKALVLSVGAGITTKLYATLVGLAGSIFLKTQISILENDDGKKKG